MVFTPADIATAAAASAKAILGDAADNLATDPAIYLRDGNPQSIPGRVGQALGRSVCRVYGATRANIPGPVGLLYESRCRPYLDSIGQGGGAGLIPGGQGGQCSGRLYRLFFQTRTPGAADSLSVEYLAYGPISAFAVVSTTNAQGQVTSWDRRVRSRGLRQLAAGAPPLSPNVVEQSIGTRTVPPGDSLSHTLFNVRVSGTGLDNCGDPPPQVKPPDTDPDPQPPPFVFAPTAGLTVNFNTVNINLDGSITFDIGTGPITFELSAGGGGGGGGEPGAGDQTSPGNPGSPGDTCPGGEADGEVPPGEELVGLLVEVLAAPPNAPRYQNNPLEPYRGIGYVRMGYPNRLGADVSAGVAAPRQFYHAQQRGLTNWSVAANIGFSLRVTPYTRPIEP